jgi:NADH-quinone oxidoreductase subunit G
MPKVTIDGKAYEFEGKQMLLQFSMDQGIEIPYFCYHPAMSIPTNCRMCLVEIGYQAKDRETGEYQFDEEGKPIVNWIKKPATSCNTPMVDGLFVKTNRTSEQISKDQKGVLEYMLVNHPLDCPICDQAGECPLQIWTYKYGPEGSRFEEMKTHKRKRVELGPNVILDEERCINCTRCTRFAGEISKSHQLTIIGRGDKNYPGTAPGTVFDDPYSMNTIDLCPVGALTSKQSRFNARPWEMAYAPSIDMNDSTGTNIFVWLRDNKVMRITPRENKDINDFWMPDVHRLNIGYYNDNRVSGVHAAGKAVSDFEEGIRKAAKLLSDGDGKFFFLGSPHASFESNFALKELAALSGNAEIHYVPNLKEGSGDGWLIQDDKSPNSAACKLLGFKEISLDDLKGRLSSGKIEYLYALEDGNTFSQLGDSLSQTLSIVHATQHTEALSNASVILPAATAIEAESIYINMKGIPQVSALAKQIRQMTPEMWMRLPKSRLDKTGQLTDHWRDAAHIFDVLPGWLLISKVARAAGKDMPYASHKEVFSKMKTQFEVLKDFKVSYKPPKEAFRISQFEFAIG